jgi:nicotinamide-nucleotide amidase
MRQIEAMYARFNRHMPEINRKQALLPAGSARIDNSWGTAPGFSVQAGRAWMAFLPGVPREMKPMFEERVAPGLGERFGLRPGRLVTLRTTGVGESDLQERVGRFDEPGVAFGTRTILPENQVKLRFEPEVTVERLMEIATRVALAVGTPVFSIEGLPRPIQGFECRGGELAEVIGRALVERGETMACAESCTGGRVAATCTAIPGSSEWFAEGMVTYSNAAKQRQLGVRGESLAAHGAVSEVVAREMAAGCRERSGADWGLAVTGIAGPGGGSAEKPVGTVHLALAGPDGVAHRLVRMGGDRARIQTWSAGAALDLLRRSLQGKTQL